MKKEQLNFIKSYTELEKLSKEKLIELILDKDETIEYLGECLGNIELILDKDETIEYLGECLGNLEYIGRMYLKEVYQYLIFLMAKKQS